MKSGGNVKKTVKDSPVKKKWVEDSRNIGLNISTDSGVVDAKKWADEDVKAIRVLIRENARLLELEEQDNASSR